MASPDASPVEPKEESGQGKRIVICLDGTGNQIGASNPTNVAKVFSMLDKEFPSRQPTAALGAVPRTLSLIYMRAVGTGLKANVAEAYQYLMHHWRPGDEISIFGFSRGAYTARALAGMLLRPGLMHPGSDNLLPYAVEKYAINRDFHDDEYEQWARFANGFCWRTDGEPLFSTIKQNNPGQVWRYAVPIAYMGLWDTVKAAGFLRLGNLRWPYTISLPNVAHIRHAVSIDERRRPYREYLIGRHPKGLQEQWFAGVHSDVGGTFEPNHRLSTIALKWVVDGALPYVDLVPDKYAANCTVDHTFANGAIHPNGPLWSLAGRRTRDIPPEATLHKSGLQRRQHDSRYLPNMTKEQEARSAQQPDWTIPGKIASD